MKIRLKRAIEDYMMKAAKIDNRSSVKSFYTLDETIFEMCGVSENDAVFDRMVTYRELERPLSIGLGFEAEGFESIQIQKWRTASYKEIRGLPVFGRVVFRMDLYALDRDMKWLRKKGFTQFYLSNDGRDFKAFNVHGAETTEKERPNKPSLPICYQVYSDAMWKASFQFDTGSPSVNVMLTDDMVSKALALRDVPEGKSRRDAAIHFVTSHKRSKPTGGETEIPDHLRGATMHLWKGCDMKVLPPYYDVEKLKPLPKVEKTKREIMAL